MYLKKKKKESRNLEQKSPKLKERHVMHYLLLPGEGALCSIPIENILAVERLEEESFKMKNVRAEQKAI